MYPNVILLQPVKIIPLITYNYYLYTMAKENIMMDEKKREKG